MNHTDIDTSGWVGRLPAAWRPYALLMRLDRPVGTWLLLLPGWWAIMLAGGGMAGFCAQTAWLFVLFAAGAVVMRGAGCVINDLWDRRFDAVVARTAARPLAAGTIGPRAALAFLAVLLMCGLAVLLQLPTPAIMVGLCSVPLIVIYPLMKRITWWPQLFLGITFNFGILIGWAALRGGLDLTALVIYAGAIFWTLGYDTIYAHQDREDDLKIGVRSTALRFGAAARPWVAGFYAVAVIVLAVGFYMAGVRWGLVFFILAIAQIVSQFKLWRGDDPAGALAAFRSNRDFGLILFIAAGF